jgi:hypothetical protein
VVPLLGGVRLTAHWYRRAFAQPGTHDVRDLAPQLKP